MYAFQFLDATWRIDRLTNSRSSRPQYGTAAYDLFNAAYSSRADAEAAIRSIRVELAMPFLGTVDAHGTIRFTGDIIACRAFLRSLGLEFSQYGWAGNGYQGVIDFSDGRYHAAAWKRTL